MNVQKEDWYCWDDIQNCQVGPLTLDALDTLHLDGKLDEFANVFTTQMLKQHGPRAQGIPYSMISRINISFAPTIKNFFEGRAGKPITVLSGPNNAGKTLLLKQIFPVVGQGGYLIACNRFSHVDVLNYRKVGEHEHRQYYDNFINNFYTSQQNVENNELQLEQIITALKDEQRTKLFNVCHDLLGNKFSLQRTDPDNTLSPFYVDMDGENLRYGSSGTRLLMTVLGILLDKRFSVILIDEPEIGLSPYIQGTLARFLYDDKERLNFCPHLKQIYIATHSHLFLDKNVFSNNTIVTKAENVISLKPLESVGDLNHLQFNMLGNQLESIFLPSAIVIVEGDSDAIFLAKVIQLHIPERKVAIVRADGEGEILKKINVLSDAFGNFETSPYRNRLFIILDKTNSQSSERIFNRQGIPEKHIVIWSKNGIEYLYPQDLVTAAFHCAKEELAIANLESDPIEINKIRKRKKELAKYVIEGMTVAHPIHIELEDLVTLIKTACD